MAETSIDTLSGRDLDVAVHRARGRQCEFFTPTEGEFGSDLRGWYWTPLEVSTAERVGRMPTPVAHYSTDWAAAGELLDELHATPGMSNLALHADNGWALTVWNIGRTRESRVAGPINSATGPEAIARA